VPAVTRPVGEALGGLGGLELLQRRYVVLVELVERPADQLGIRRFCWWGGGCGHWWILSTRGPGRATAIVRRSSERPCSPTSVTSRRSPPSSCPTSTLPWAGMPRPSASR